MLWAPPPPPKKRGVSLGGVRSPAVVPGAEDIPAQSPQTKLLYCAGVGLEGFQGGARTACPVIDPRARAVCAARVRKTPPVRLLCICSVQ